MINDLEFKLAKHLKSCGIENSYLEARRILERTNKEQEAFELALRRCSGEPLAYILNERGFYKDVFYVQPGVLIPRPETEILVEEAIRILKMSSTQDPLFYDFGCGSGCIGLSILRDFPQARLIGLDISEAAIQVSVRNAKSLSLDLRSQFVSSKVSDFHFVDKADLIVANPPYIAMSDDRVEEGVKKFEPHEALFSEEDGLKDIREWSKTAFSILKTGGSLLMEFGINQENAVQKQLETLGFSDIKIYKDLAGIDRAVSATKP